MSRLDSSSLIINLVERYLGTLAITSSAMAEADFGGRVKDRQRGWGREHELPRHPLTLVAHHLCSDRVSRTRIRKDWLTPSSVISSEARLTHLQEDIKPSESVHGCTEQARCIFVRILLPGQRARTIDLQRAVT